MTPPTPGTGARVSDCPFCAIVAGAAPADDLINYGDVLSFTPLRPVTLGHRLFVPTAHVRDATEDPVVTGRVMARVARWIAPGEAANIIASVGAEATQSIFHLHVHVVPRRKDDGLKLPWTGVVAPDLRERARRECAEELQAELRRSPSTPRVAAERVIRRWSAPPPPSGADEEGGTR